MMYLSFLRALGRGQASPGQGPSAPSALFESALAAVNAADVIARAPDDNGPRVAVIAPGLGGSFYWDHDEARRRVESHFNLGERDTLRVVRALLARVKLAAQPAPAPRCRASFVNSWRDERNLECFEQ
jgi:hypothetical protein